MKVLCYHSNNINGSDYKNNDHIALKNDLELIRIEGFKVISLHQAVMKIIQGEKLCPSTIVLTCDDGSWFDWYDLEHPSLGLQESFRKIIERERIYHPDLQMTSFVIASPEDRSQLDKTCLAGLGWWGDDWWSDAEESGIISIENHSWDHNHETLNNIISKLESPKTRARGTFKNIDDKDMADYQIRQAQQYLKKFRKKNKGFFAYPYGEYNEYLTKFYFPKYGDEIGILAAFTTEPEPITTKSNRWMLPRYVCGWHWKSTEDLLNILRY